MNFKTRLIMIILMAFISISASIYSIARSPDGRMMVMEADDMEMIASDNNRCCKCYPRPGYTCEVSAQCCIYWKGVDCDLTPCGL